MVLLGPWQVLFCEQGSDPRPIVKKKRLSTFFGTLAGNLALAKLRIFLTNFVANVVSLNTGRDGLRRGSFLFLLLEFVAEGFWSYSSIPAVVVLSKEPGPVAYGLAAIRKVELGALALAMSRTLVVCPGVMSTMWVLKGFT